jgi:hypothetical protein
MQNAKNKIVATLIALFLMSTVTISLVALPTASASTKQTYCVIGATPNPVGVGQPTLILLGITDATASTQYYWILTVTVTHPDGTTETLGPFHTDSTGMTGTDYTPSTVGNYTIVVHFPQQNATSSTGSYAVNTTMLASDSEPLTLVVQQQPRTFNPGYPLPTEYWTRPVDDQLWEWSSIDGNWLTTPRNFLAYGNNAAPESAHILWVTPLTSGGQTGGTLNPYEDVTTQVGQAGASGQIGYDPGDAYEGKWSGSLTMGGKLYYQKYASGDAYKEIICVDLHTGQQLWDRVLLNNLTLTRGQMFYWQTYDFYGVYDYLWATANTATLPLLGLNSTAGTTWCAFDPFTGDFVYAMYGIPAGTVVYGDHGELLIYQLSTTGGYMYMWNSSNIDVIRASTVYGSMAWGQWRPMGKIMNATGPNTVTLSGPYRPTTMPLNLTGYQWNVTSTDFKSLVGSVRVVWQQDRIIGGLQNTTDVVTWAIDLRPGHEGSVLYNYDWKAPADWLAGNLTISLGTTSQEYHVFTVNAKESRLRYCFSTDTGQYMWTISEPIAMLGHLTGGPSGEGGVIAYGMLYCGTVSGVMEAYNITNGKLVWKYNVNDPYMQVLYSNNFPMGWLIAAGGKMYVGQMEHSGNQPLPRGGPMVCFNATTGEVIWRANGLFRQTVWGGRAVIGDSIIATMDTYDQRVYAIGKGPSATTVQAPLTAITEGNTVVIQGTVMDVSPGTKDISDGLPLRFPNGVPAVSDDSMSDWMGYVYKHFTLPTNTTGVTVTLDAIDPNGNFVHIGTVKSDTSGLFHYSWKTPAIPGDYTVIATFMGSKAYYASYAEAGMYVEAAPPTPTPTPAAPLPPDTTMTIIGAAIAIIIVVIIVGILTLRKK